MTFRTGKVVKLGTLEGSLVAKCELILQQKFSQKLLLKIHCWVVDVAESVERFRTEDLVS